MINEPEWKTRKERIDKKLKSLNPPWDIVKYSDQLKMETLDKYAVEEFPTANGPADYALFVKGKFLGIIEAKKVTVDPYNVLEQAKRYAKGAFNGPGNWNGYWVPFLYASNGEKIWFLDVRSEMNTARQLPHFHTFEALEEFYSDDKAEGLHALSTNPTPVEKLRYYQREAIEAIESGMYKGKRSMLVAMATGTGKTFATVALIYRVLRAKAARRILFLVDRRALLPRLFENLQPSIPLPGASSTLNTRCSVNGSTERILMMISPSIPRSCQRPISPSPA